MILEGETVLEDEYPVYAGYIYVAVGGEWPEDGQPVESPLEGDVRRLKADIGAREIRRCELIRRETQGDFRVAMLF